MGTPNLTTGCTGLYVAQGYLMAHFYGSKHMTEVSGLRPEFLGFAVGVVEQCRHVVALSTWKQCFIERNHTLARPMQRQNRRILRIEMRNNLQLSVRTLLTLTAFR